MKLSLALLSMAATVTAFAPSLTTSSRTTSLSMVNTLNIQTGQSQLDTAVIDRFNSLAYPADKALAEYVWVDANGNTRSKTRTLPVKRTSAVESLPRWNFDGSSTGQAPGDDSEVILRPCRIFKDPFRPRADGVDNILVMCDTYTPAGEPLPTNTRAIAAKAFEGKEDEEIWFGLEQEFTLFNLDQRTPLGWPKGGVPARPQGPYYCSVGPENSFGRAITDAHYRACLYAGIEISGTNGEVMPGQQEYQVGPCVGIDAGDQLFMSRYILQRVCEEFQVYCTLHPKPIVEGDWNGAGMHTNVSTKSMREPGGLEIIKKAIYKLAAKHQEHIAVYGEGNELRLTGKFETASIEKFSFGVANRGASVRIGRDTEAEGMGYFEDRRPSSNADPYLVTGKIMATIMEDVEVPEVAALDRESA
jgi:glutamine synthetase